MAEHLESFPLLSKRFQHLDRQEGTEFYTASRCDLRPFNNQGRVVTRDDGDIPIEQSRSRSGIQSQAHADLSTWSPQTCGDHNQPYFRVEWLSHKTIAMSLGNSPV